MNLTGIIVLGGAVLFILLLVWIRKEVKEDISRRLEGKPMWHAMQSIKKARKKVIPTEKEVRKNKIMRIISMGLLLSLVSFAALWLLGSDWNRPALYLTMIFAMVVIVYGRWDMIRGMVRGS